MENYEKENDKEIVTIIEEVNKQDKLINKSLEQKYINLISKQRENRNLKAKNNLDRKARTHKLIVLGTIFKILELEDVNQDLLIGLLMGYYKLTDKEKQKLIKKGELFKKTRTEMLAMEGENNEN